MADGRVDLAPEDRDDLMEFLGMAYIEDLRFVHSVPPGTVGRAEALRDLDAEDRAMARLRQGTPLTEREIIRYVQLIERLPDGAFSSSAERERRDGAARRIRALMRAATAQR